MYSLKSVVVLVYIFLYKIKKIDRNQKKRNYLLLYIKNKVKNLTVRTFCDTLYIKNLEATENTSNSSKLLITFCIKYYLKEEYLRPFSSNVAVHFLCFTWKSQNIINYELFIRNTTLYNMLSSLFIIRGINMVFLYDDTNMHKYLAK